MKKVLPAILAISSLLACQLPAQTSVTGVSTVAQNKIAVLEEFTGVRCPNCPDGHQVIGQIQGTHGNNVIVVSYHPNNSSFTPPYAGDPDLQRAYPAAFYTMPYCGSSRFMPSAFINRREYSGEKIQSRGVWPSYVSSMITESSPLNVGVIATYDSISQMLSVTAEVYYTSTVAEQNSIYVVLAESGIVVAQQSGATGSYTQNHVFREGFADQWGDAINTTSQGTLARFDYTFDNSTLQYDMSQAEVLAFVENKSNEELYSGAQSDVSFGVVSSISDLKALEANVYPNPTSGNARIVFELPAAGNVRWSVTSIQGAELLRGESANLPAGRHQQAIASEDFAPGIYFVRIESEHGSVLRRLAVQ